MGPGGPRGLQNRWRERSSRGGFDSSLRRSFILFIIIVHTVYANVQCLETHLFFLRWVLSCCYTGGIHELSYSLCTPDKIEF
jgi:hypothetical protein